MAAMVLGATSCKQEDRPEYMEPTSFYINEPALKYQALCTADDMLDNSTFNIFCNQPDYGYSAVCQYTALVSLNPEAEASKWIALNNTTPNSANMAIKTYDLGVAVNKLLGVTDEEIFNEEGYGNQAFKVYFKAVCEIPGIEGSQIVSDNIVSYDNVWIKYAVEKPGWLYVCGDVQNIETGEVNGFTGPAAANMDAYLANWVLYEPADMIGEKLYVGVFNLVAKDDAKNPATANSDDPNQCAQFRFFTELLGWSPDASLGSNQADFYCEKITTEAESDNGYEGKIIEQGLGNWGIFVTENTPCTMVVDVPNGFVYFKVGNYNVTFDGRTPTFEPKEN